MDDVKVKTTDESQALINNEMETTEAPEISQVEPMTPTENQLESVPALEQLAKPVDVEKREKIDDDLMKNVTQEVVKQITKDDIGAKMALNAVTFAPSIVEDVYNFGVDLINFADTKFGDGKDLIQYSDYISRWQPQDSASQFGRSAAKLIVGYSAALKGVQALTGKHVGMAKYAQDAASGFMSEIALLKPEGEPLLKQFLKKVPVTNEWMDYLHADDGNDTALEKRLENSLYGIFEGAFIDGLMKTAKFMRKVYKTDDSLVGQFLRDESGTVGKGGDEPPPIPENVGIDKDLPPVIEEVTESDRVAAKRLLDEWQLGNRNAELGALNPNRATISADDYIDLTSIDASDSARNLARLMVEQNPEFFARIPTTDAELVRLAKKHNLTPEKLLQFEVEAGVPKGMIYAAGIVEAQALKQIDRMAMGVKRGEVSIDDFVMAEKTVEQITRQYKDLRSMGGFLQRESQQVAKVVNGNKRKHEMIRIFKGDSERLVEEMTKQPNKIEELREAFSRFGQNTADMLTQIRYAGLLISPTTHARNIYGGVQTTLARPAETVLAATMNSIKKDPYGVQFGEAYHELAGMSRGILEALTIASQKARKATAGGEFLGVDPKKAKLPQFVNGSTPVPDDKMGKFFYYLTETLGNSRVGRTLQLEDNMIKHVNARMTLNREAYKKAHLQKQMDPNLTPKDIDELIAAELRTPSEDTLAKMYSDAEYNTFTNDIPKTAKNLKFFDELSKHPIGRIVAPFAKVNLNVMSYTLERLPVARRFVDRSRRELHSIDPSVRQRAQAKMAFASTTLTALGFYLHSQDAIVGSGTSNPDKRKFAEANGYQPGSIKFGNEWVEYRKETPFGAILSFMADMAELKDALPETEAHVLDDMGMILVSTVSQLYNPEYLTDGAGKILEAFADPNKKAGKAAVEYMGDLALSYTPYSAGARLLSRELTGGEKRETYTPASVLNSIANKFKSIYMPYLNARKRNLFGDPIIYKQGLGPDIISPFGLTPESNDSVVKEMARLSDASTFVEGLVNEVPLNQEGSEFQFRDPNVGTFSMPNRTIYDPILREPLALNTKDYEKLVLLTAGVEFDETENGLKVKKEGPNSLRNRIKKVMDMPAYQKASDAKKIDMIKPIISFYKKQGEIKFFGLKENKQAVKRILDQRMQELKEVYGQ